MIQVGADAVTVLGVLGEADRLSEAERAKIIEKAVHAAAGRLPVVVGVSHTGTEGAIQLAQKAQSQGAGGLLVASIKEAIPDEQRIFEFYQRLAEKVSIPICIHDYPVSTGVHLSVPLLLRLIEQVPPIASVKVEAVPSPAKIAALSKRMARRKATL